ncbi:MAG: late competence development ComFB family protein [Cyanobacteria bacterium P01_C01_bin.120]
MKELKLPHTRRAYINVMESLVTQEVENQLQRVPARVRRYLKLEEVVTYALNRLPTLYASSQKGWQYQQKTASQNMEHQITDTVRQAIAAVQVDPLRLSQPLNLADGESEAVLQALRTLFQMPDLNWDGALEKLSELPNQGSESSVKTPTQPWQPTNRLEQAAWTHRRRRPETSKQEAKKPQEPPQEPKTAEPKSQETWGWDDPRYRL